MIVIPSSVIPPKSSIEPVERKAITQLTEKVAASRVTTVCAPAGFGKTTAIREWTERLAAERRPTMWIAARSGFHSLEQFLSTLCEAGRVAGFDWPSLPAETLQPLMLCDFASPERGRPVLVIEDAQFLPENIITFLVGMIGNARDSLTTILSTRGQSAIPVARLRSLGYLVEVGVEELRFTKSQTAGLIRTFASVPVEQAWIDTVQEHMDGWPAGTLAAANFPAPAGMIEAHDERTTLKLRQQIKEYFDEEVLASLSEQTRAFLLDISVFNEMCRDEAMAVTLRGDSGTRLEAAAQQGLFIDLVDAKLGIYRFHPLFREMLRNRLADQDAAHASMLHRRAAGYYLTQGSLIKAADHADASGDLEFLGEALDGVAEAMTYAGHLETVVRLAEKLPWAILSRRPGIMLCLAWRKIRALSFKSAEELLAATHVQIERIRETGDSARASQLELLFRHRHSLLAAARDDMQQVERLSEQLLSDFGDDNAYVSCTLLAQLMAARRELFHFHDTLKLEAETRRALNQPGSNFASIALKASVAPTLAMQGKIETARQLLEQSLAMAETFRGASSGLAALPALPLAELNYDLGDLDQARDLVDRHLGVAREFGYSDQLCAGHLVRARLFAANHELPKALAALDEAHLVALECGLDRLRSFAMALQVQLLLRDGQREAAQRAFMAAGFDLTQEPVPTMTPSRCQEAIAIAWIRLEAHQHRLSRARRIAKRWQELVKRSGATRSVVLFDLLLAEIATLAGESSEARRHIRNAVSTACEPGWTRIFIDEGEIVGALLLEAYGDSPLVDTAADQFAAKLLGSIGSKPQLKDAEEGDSGLGDRIVGREIEILSLVGGGLRNREIGNRLGLTEGTVKWYMQQIYDKLGVRRRPQAVMRARTLGLLR